MEEVKPEAVAQESPQEAPQPLPVNQEAPPQPPPEAPKEALLEPIPASKPPQKRPFWPLLVVLGLLMGIAIYYQGLHQVKSHPLPQPLPTEMVLKGSVYKVQKAINRLFKTDPVQIFQNPPDHPPSFKLYWKGDHHPEGLKIFRNPVNENDVYISCNRQPICKSTVYTNGWGKPLEYLADFQLHIIPQGAKETLVKVVVVDPEVVAGKTNSAVEATTVEESEIISALKQTLKKDHSSK